MLRVVRHRVVCCLLKELNYKNTQTFQLFFSAMKYFGAAMFSRHTISLVHTEVTLCI